jgi:hypothetical protein
LRDHVIGAVREVIVSSWLSRVERYFQGPAESVGLPRLVPWQVIAVFLVSGVVLVPWTIYLFLTLPIHDTVSHWRLAWGGFDIILIITLSGTGVRILRRSPKGIIVSTAAGTLLMADAWFDVLLSSTPWDRLVAGAMALFVELPMAALCLSVAFAAIRRIEEARHYLLQAGFHVTSHHVVPPDNWPR